MTQPITSLLANEASKQRRPANHDKILAAMDKLPNNEGFYETIAARCTLDAPEVGRRLGELEKLGKVIRTGKTGITSRGCRAAIWKLVKEPVPNIQQTLFGN